MPAIRAIVIAVVRHPRTGALLVGESRDSVKEQVFHRPLGGGIEFGESAADALTREFAEEIGARIVVGRRVATLENRFTFEGDPGHEIVFVHEAELSDPSFYDRTRMPVADTEDEIAVWRAPDVRFEDIPLFPEGLTELLAGPRTAVTREAHKASSDRATLDVLLDGIPVGHIGLVADGGPVVIPTFVARDGDRLLAHGSTGSRWMRSLAAGVPASVAVTAFDGIVLARSVFESSLHYRSAVLFGSFTALEGSDKLSALDIMVESIAPGRTAEVRASTTAELAATLVLAMPIDTWSLKVSDGWPDDPPEDLAGPAWAGVLPVTTHVCTPLVAPDLRPGMPLPASVARLASDTHSPCRSTGVDLSP